MNDDSLQPSGDELSAAEIEEARRLFDALQAFRRAYPDMTVAQAAALLLTASSTEPLSMSRLRHALGVAASTATRAVLTLTRVSPGRGRGRGRGPGLVTQSVDQKDRRWRFAHCTPDGFDVVRRVLQAARGDDNNAPS